MRDTYSFAPGDPDITLPRAFVVDILNSLEMWGDHVRYATGKEDAHTMRTIERLTALLQAD